MVKSMNFSKDYLHECFMYDDGKLYWKERPENHFESKRAWKAINTRISGKEAGVCRKNSFYVKINKKNVNTRQIIWVMFNGGVAPDNIINLDGDVNNNRIENLVSTKYKQRQITKRKHIYPCSKGYVVYVPGRRRIFFKSLETAVLQRDMLLKKNIISTNLDKC